MCDMKPTAVFDTGIFLQATISLAGPAARVLRMFDDNKIILYISNALLIEIKDVLTRPTIRRKNSSYSDKDINDLLSRQTLKGKLILEPATIFSFERDPNDEHIINLAIESKANYLVSRDKDLLDLSTNSALLALHPDLVILDPVEFLQRIDPPIATASTGSPL